MQEAMRRLKQARRRPQALFAGASVRLPLQPALRARAPVRPSSSQDEPDLAQDEIFRRAAQAWSMKSAPDDGGSSCGANGERGGGGGDLSDAEAGPSDGEQY